MVRFGGIEVLVDPGGAKNIGFGLEIQIEGRGSNTQETVESWTWATRALVYYMRAAAETGPPEKPGQEKA